VSRYPGHNHVCNFWWRSVKGLGVARGRISRFPIDLRRRPYYTFVWVIDYACMRVITHLWMSLNQQCQGTEGKLIISVQINHMSCRDFVLLCWIQGTTGRCERASVLCDILKRRDHALLPTLWQALLQTGQEPVARLLGFIGLYVICSISSKVLTSTMEVIQCIPFYSSVRIGTSDLKMLVDSFLYPANKWLTTGTDWIISGLRIVFMILVTCSWLPCPWHRYAAYWVLF